MLKVVIILSRSLTILAWLGSIFMLKRMTSEWPKVPTYSRQCKYVSIFCKKHEITFVHVYALICLNYCNFCNYCNKSLHDNRWQEITISPNPIAEQLIELLPFSLIFYFCSKVIIRKNNTQIDHLILIISCWTIKFRYQCSNCCRSCHYSSRVP